MFKRIRAKQAKRQQKEDPDQETFNDIISTDSDSDDSDDSSSSSGSESGPADLGDTRLTVAEALSNPIFGSDLDEVTRSCAVCPGVLLKNSHMAEIHLNSKVGKLLVQSHPHVRSSYHTFRTQQSHHRRFKRLNTYVESNRDISIVKMSVEDVLESITRNALRADVANEQDSRGAQKVEH